MAGSFCPGTFPGGPAMFRLPLPGQFPVASLLVLPFALQALVLRLALVHGLGVGAACEGDQGNQRAGGEACGDKPGGAGGGVLASIHGVVAGWSSGAGLIVRRVRRVRRGG